MSTKKKNYSFRYIVKGQLVKILIQNRIDNLGNMFILHH
jgi:hypothetical protein